MVGVGTEAGAPVPKYTEKNQLIGYWSHDSMQLAPGAAPIAAAGLLKRTKDVAENPQDRFISKLSENTMQAMAKEIGASYVRGDTYQKLKSAMRQQKPARREWTFFSLSAVLSALAGLLLIAAYMPWHWFGKNRKRAQKNTISHQAILSSAGSNTAV